MTDDERTPDRFELAVRKWTAQLELLDNGRVMTEREDLDPALLEDLHRAYAEQDDDGFLEALGELCRCWLIARRGL